MYEAQNVHGQHEAVYVRCNAGSMIALLNFNINGGNGGSH